MPVTPASQPLVEDRLLNAHEAAAMLSIKPSTLVQYRKAGSKIQGPPFVRFSTSVIRYKLSDILAYIAGKESQV